MSKRIFIDGSINSELCIIATDGQEINYFDYSDDLIASKKNNIYLGIVSRVEPSLQAAFIDFGSEKKAFLPFDEIHPSYFKIPHNEKLIETKDDKNNDAEEEKQNRKNFLSFYRKYKIQDVIKKDQVLLIQIVKEERGTKGAAITTFISLPGRYSVLLPNNSSNGGVSKKISNPLDRKRLKKLHDGFNLPDGMSIIIRTNAISAEDEDIIADFNYLRKLWTKIREETLKSKAPKLISELDTPIIKVARDLNQRSVDEIIFSDLKTMKEYKKLESEFSVNKNKKITHYKEKLPLFESFGIKNPINSLSEENIYMKSGGYLVINPTEALTSIDINSGRSTSEKNIEITALNTNLEACEEIFKQVQLRNIAGLIVIDFIDMSINGNNNKVERKIKELFYKDRARVQLTKISQFGLMEISRQRIGQSVYETFYKKCECCNGNGLRKTKSIIFHNIISLIKNLNSLDKTDEYEIQIDKIFFQENKVELIKRVKALKLKFDVKFIELEEGLIHKVFEIDKKVLELINSKSKENIIKNNIPETNSEKSYRRKIKKKSIEEVT
ncbi:MAG: Rne/Rng family ribonuclease [alpha proteobacterium HIMB59]|nr:MAG: Rne/Rng family ribonuclease [alpha proteobacterium HIMB59]|tara:strand:+ start:1942 stop:3606 length:1665 start_codon:yes stop_codon:yes gene_type:complete